MRGTEHDKPGLLRVLGLAFGLAVVVGGAVGQGILRSPGPVAALVGSAATILVLWVLGGLLAATDACAVVELATSHPRAGGPYAFARKAFGPSAGILIGWADWFQGMVALAFLAVVFGEYLGEAGIASPLPVGGTAMVLLATIAVLHWRGTRVSGASQILGTLLKAALLGGVVAALAVVPATPSQPQPIAPATTAAGIVVALRLVFTTYAGWNGSCYFCEELRAPERNVVRATFIGIGFITVLYVAFNAALLAVMSPAEMAGSKLAVADALQRALGGVSGLVVALIALVSVGAIANLYAMQFTRVVFAMARERVLPAALASVAPGGTPRAAMLTTLGAALVFASSGSYEALVAISAVPAAAINLVVDLSAIRLRRLEPNLPRPWRMPFYPLPALAGAAINAALIVAMIWEDPVNSGLGLAMLAAVAIVYATAGTVRRAAA
jgi:APA family basic amino acid/polyamine antiporter